MSINQTYQIVAVGEIVLQCQPREHQIPNDVQQKINKIWKNEYQKKNKKLFNDKVLNFENIIKKNDTTIVNVDYIDYKSVLAERKDPSLNLGFYAVGVSGLVLLRENNLDYVLFALRGANSTEYPYHLELVPSGHLDMSVLQDNGIVDYKKKVRQEFNEETGLSLEFIEKTKSICLAKDIQNRVYDVCCLLQVKGDRKTIISGLQNAAEYTNPTFVPLAKLSDFINLNSKRLIPTSKAILECFLNL